MTYWDADKINAGTKAHRRREAAKPGPGVDQDDADGGASPEEMCDLASEFVRSSDLWAYGKMLVLVNSIVLQLEWFANSCACHRHVATVIRSFGFLYRFRWKHMNSFHYSSIGADCPVRGCVGPELAAGDFMAAFQRFREIASAEVLRLVADVFSSVTLEDSQVCR